MISLHTQRNLFTYLPPETFLIAFPLFFPLAMLELSLYQAILPLCICVGVSLPVTFGFADGLWSTFVYT